MSDDFDLDPDDTCPRCGGEGWIMAADGDGSDWGEDTYCGPLDAEIECRECRGTGSIKPPTLAPQPEETPERCTLTVDMFTGRKG